MKKNAKELIIETNKECDNKIEKCNKDCENREREAHEYCQKMMKVIDTIENEYTGSDDFVEIICFDKEFIVNKRILINSSDYFKAYFQIILKIQK